MARLKLHRVALAVATLGCCNIAMADPVSIVATIGAAVGGSFGATLIMYAGAIGTGLSIAATVAFSALSSNSAKKKQAQAAAAQRSAAIAGLQDRSITALSGESAWKVVYGLNGSVGGALLNILSSGDKDQNKHLLVAFAAHESLAIDEVYLDGEPVGPLDIYGWCTTGAFLENRGDKSRTDRVIFDTSGNGVSLYPVQRILQAEGDLSGIDSEGRAVFPRYNVTAVGQLLTMSPPPLSTVLVNVAYTYAEITPRVNVQKHLSPGGQDSPDYFVMGQTSAWGPADLLSGHTYIWILLDQYLERFRGAPPNITVRMRGKLVYDFRTGTTGYSSNPALCLADFLMSESGFGAALAQIDAPSVIAAANACDAQGFSCDGAFSTDQDREMTKQQLEESFGGTCFQSGGVWRIMAGAWTTPVMTLTDADQAAPIDILQTCYTAKERYNTVRGKYIDLAALGVASDFTPWSNPAYLTTDGLARVKDVAFAFTSAHQRCQDLARMLVERSRGGLTISYPAFARAWPLQPGDRVWVTNAEYGWSSKSFRVVDWSFSPQAPVVLTLVEDVAVYYDAAAVITADATPNTNLPNPFAVPVLSNLAAASGTQYLQKQSDGTINSRVFVSWSPTTSNYVVTGGNVEVQWRLASATDDAWQSTKQPGNAASCFLTEAEDGRSILVRARFVTDLGISGLWSTFAHTVIGKTEPPSAVTSVALTQTLVFYTGVNDIDLAGYEIRVVPGTVAQWSLGVPVHAGLVTDSPYQLLRRLTGVQTVMVAAVDDGGRVGLMGYSTLDFGVIDPYNIAQQIDFAALGWPGFMTNASVVGGAVLADADPAVDFWAIGGDDFWTHDNAADFWGGSAYLAMQYIATYTPAYSGGDVILDTSAIGSRVVIEWRVDGGLTGDFWARSVGGDFWGGTADFWGEEQVWQPYIGSLTSVANQGLHFRVSIDGGPQQGQITAEAIRLQMPDKEQIFPNITISATGTRLPPGAGSPAVSWIAIEEAYPTVIYADGSGAAYGRVTNFDPVLGPQVETLNTSGTPVTGTAQTWRVTGY